MVVGICSAHGASLQGTNWDDGKSHTIDGGLSIEGDLRLDQNVNDNTSTLLQLKENGHLNGDLLAYGKSSVKISGGKIEKNLYLYGEAALWLENGEIGQHIIAQKDIATVGMTGGVVSGDLRIHDITSGFISGGAVRKDVITYDNGSISIRGGVVHGDIKAVGESVIKIMGGTVTGLCYVYDDAQIYFLGKAFTLNGISLKHGEKLSQYLTPVKGRPYLEGQLKGVLEKNDELLDVTIRIYNSGNHKGVANMSVDIVSEGIPPKLLWTIVAGIAVVLMILSVIKSKKEKSE